MAAVGTSSCITMLGLSQLKDSARLQVLNPNPETRNPKLEPRNSNPNLETRSPKPEARSPKHETRNTKPETRNPKPETRNACPCSSACITLLGLSRLKDSA